MTDELNCMLATYKENPVYIPNVGNAGDAFIAHATYQLFSRIGVTYETGSLSGQYPGRVVICGGGGNLVPEYDNMATFLRNNRKCWSTLIILPHTIRAYGDVFGDMDSNCFIFCREKQSFDFVKRNAPKANVFVSHDLAFGWRREDTEVEMTIRSMRDIARVMTNLRRRARLERRLRSDALRIREMMQRDTLNAFRTDAEKTQVDVPPHNIDVSDLFTDNSMDPLIVLHTTFRMLRFLSQFRAIKTNRLHIAIMSGILGLDVDFYDNNYGKNRDVYEHSMRGRYENIRWLSHASTTAV